MTRIVVTGATGNVGTSVVSVLTADPDVSVVGLARRVPVWRPPRTRWISADVAVDKLEPQFEGADCVIHLAWQIQPSHDEARLERVNVEGTRRVAEAAARVGVPALVHASSVGAYSPAPRGRRVDESWPTEGIPTSVYSRQKVAAERFLDAFEQSFPALRVVRLRPCLIFQRASGPEQRRYFLGRLVPPGLLRPGRLPVSPKLPGLEFQAVHADDVARAYRLAALRPVRGAFNVAADQVIDSERLAELLHARTVDLSPGTVRRALGATWRLRLQPTEPGWLDLGLEAPLLDTSRAERVLGWTAVRSGTAALAEALAGAVDQQGFPTPPLRGG